MKKQQNWQIFGGPDELGGKTEEDRSLYPNHGLDIWAGRPLSAPTAMHCISCELHGFFADSMFTFYFWRACDAGWIRGVVQRTKRNYSPTQFITGRDDPLTRVQFFTPYSQKFVVTITSRVLCHKQIKREKGDVCVKAFCTWEPSQWKYVFKRAAWACSIEARLVQSPKCTSVCTCKSGFKQGGGGIWIQYQHIVYNIFPHPQVQIQTGGGYLNPTISQPQYCFLHSTVWPRV